MTYALIRGKQFVSAPDGYDPRCLIPPVLALCDTPDQAWVSHDLDLAIERASLLRLCWGWSTEVRALRPTSHQ